MPVRHIMKVRDAYVIMVVYKWVYWLWPSYFALRRLNRMMHLSLQVCCLRRYCSSKQLTAWSLRVLRAMTSTGCLMSTKRCIDRLRGESSVVMTSWREELTIWWVMKSGYLLTVILVELRLTGSLKLTNEITVDLTRLSKIKYFTMTWEYAMTV